MIAAWRICTGPTCGVETGADPDLGNDPVLVCRRSRPRRSPKSHHSGSMTPRVKIGIEVLLVRAGDAPHSAGPAHVPQHAADRRRAVAARNDAGASVFGTRWTYDATGGPAYLAAAATTALTGGRTGRRVRRRRRSTTSFSSLLTMCRVMSRAALVIAPPPGRFGGDAGRRHPDVHRNRSCDLILSRVVGAARRRGNGKLTGIWTDRTEPCLLVSVTTG